MTDLIEQMLLVDPKDRIKMKQIQQHPWVKRKQLKMRKLDSYEQDRLSQNSGGEGLYENDGYIGHTFGSP